MVVNLKSGVERISPPALGVSPAALAAQKVLPDDKRTDALASKFVAALILFSITEVILFEAAKHFQLALAIAEYTLVIALFVYRRTVGISLHLAFTLLSMGAWSYVTTEGLPNTYWGLRMGGVSFNIVLTLGFAAIALVTRNPLEIYRSAPFEIRATLWIFAGGAGYGALRVAGGANYYDAWYADMTVYSPVVMYLILLNEVGRNACMTIVKSGMACAVFAMALSSVIGQSFDYGDGYKFALISAIGYIGVVAVPFMYSQYGIKIYCILLACVAFLVAKGALFIGGKTIVLCVVFFFWSAVRSWRAGAIAIGTTLVLFYFRAEIATFLFTKVLTGDLMEYKYSQLEEVFRVDSMHELAASSSSMGNLAAEAASIGASHAADPFSAFIGRGFGGGVADTYGYLSPLARPGAGYTMLDAVRNYFWRMHLPVLEVALKGGFLGLIMYATIGLTLLRRQSIFALAAFVVLALVVTNTKEMILCYMILTICCTGSAGAWGPLGLQLQGPIHGRPKKPNRIL